jgi:hypothetical protein
MEEEEMLSPREFDGERIGNGLCYVDIIASNHDDSTVKIRGAIEVDIETSSGDVCIEIGDRSLGVAWYGEWCISDDFHQEDGEYTQALVDDVLTIRWTLPSIDKVEWSVHHAL